MSFTEAEVTELVDGFERHTLPRGRWTHAAYLTVAFSYLERWSFDQALGRLRIGIRGYNDATGVANTATTGYHETTTVFFLRAVQKCLIGLDPALPLAARLEAVLTACGDPDLPLRYYSRARLFSTEARERWIDPDLH